MLGAPLGEVVGTDVRRAYSSRLLPCDAPRGPFNLVEEKRVFNAPPQIRNVQTSSEMIDGGVGPVYDRLSQRTHAGGSPFETRTVRPLVLLRSRVWRPATVRPWSC